MAQDHLEEFNRVCSGYGLTPGTPGFNQCLSDQYTALGRVMAAKVQPAPEVQPPPAVAPQTPPEPTFMQRLAAATQELYAERKAREAAQTTTVCHKDFSGDLTCQTQ